MTIKTKDKAKIEKLLASAYISLAHTEYNLSGSVNTKPLKDFRSALNLLKLEIGRFLPTEHGEI